MRLKLLVAGTLLAPVRPNLLVMVILQGPHYAVATSRASSAFLVETLSSQRFPSQNRTPPARSVAFVLGSGHAMPDIWHRSRIL